MENKYKGFLLYRPVFSVCHATWIKDEEIMKLCNLFWNVNENFFVLFLLPISVLMRLNKTKLLPEKTSEEPQMVLSTCSYLRRVQRFLAALRFPSVLKNEAVFMIR
ncbi:hypothetical protein RCL_jg13992.t1 [Rhizophagus clarus]|uniref:Uncharacterized protein n=1 Tax=Rhizophagus clarus TaxID=94130 RepID=A0A8H3LUZ0_9GLOM|nr:hypothetical protein RCL_jg13992.t1 [Rhizophagus clarus]